MAKAHRASMIVEISLYEGVDGYQSGESDEGLRQTQVEEHHGLDQWEKYTGRTDPAGFDFLTHKERVVSGAVKPYIQPWRV